MRIVAAGGADITITSPLQSAGADALTNSTSGIPTYDLLSGFNGSSWDRLRALGDDSDGVASASLGRLLALARLVAFNGSTYDRLLSEGNDRDAIANTTLGSLQTLGFPHGYNGTTWDRLRSEGNDRDAISNTTLGSLQTLGFPNVFNGTTWDRLRSLGTAALEGLGVASVSSAVPTASAVKSIGIAHASTTKATVITPTSGKRIRVISAHLALDPTSGNIHGELYFGDAANLAADQSKAIISNVATTDDSNGIVTINAPDGGGPVGSVDEVISVRGTTDAGMRGAIHYREE